MTQYEVIETEKFGEIDTVIKRTNADGSVTYIPTDPANSDYQRYLNPEAEHFTPILPA